jgi:hypothetical protein
MVHDSPASKKKTGKTSHPRRLKNPGAHVIRSINAVTQKIFRYIFLNVFNELLRWCKFLAENSTDQYRKIKLIQAI